MTKRLTEGSRKRTAFLVLFWLALIPFWVIVFGQVVSDLTGQRWIPSLGAIQWGFLLILALVLIMLRMAAEELFPSEDHGGR